MKLLASALVSAAIGLTIVGCSDTASTPPSPLIESTAPTALPTTSPATAPVSQAAENADFGVTRVMHVGGEGRWDYVTVDPSTQLLYVPRQTHVQVIKSDNGEVVGDIKNTPGVHGVALVPERHRGFASNGQANTVTVFDLNTRAVIGNIIAGEKPDAILYDPASKKVLAFNGKSHDVTVIDPAADPDKAAVMTISLAGAPESAAADGNGRVFVNLEDKAMVAAIDTRVMEVTSVWKIRGGEEPTGIACDAAHHRVYCGCHNELLIVLDTDTGSTMAALPLGKGVDACTFDPATGEAFASCGDGTLTIAKEVSPGSFTVTQTVQTRTGARTVTLDPTTHTLYLPTAELGEPAKAGGRPVPKPNTFMMLVVSRSRS